MLCTVQLNLLKNKGNFRKLLYKFPIDMNRTCIRILLTWMPDPEPNQHVADPQHLLNLRVILYGLSHIEHSSAPLRVL